MADFCKQCSEMMWGSDTKDLANLMEPDQYTDEMGAGVLCECCGPIVVDIDGKRMSAEFFPSCDCADQLTPTARNQRGEPPIQQLPLPGIDAQFHKWHQEFRTMLYAAFGWPRSK